MLTAQKLVAAPLRTSARHKYQYVSLYAVRTITITSNYVPNDNFCAMHTTAYITRTYEYIIIPIPYALGTMRTGGSISIAKRGRKFPGTTEVLGTQRPFNVLLDFHCRLCIAHYVQRCQSCSPASGRRAAHRRLFPRLKQRDLSQCTFRVLNYTRAHG